MSGRRQVWSELVAASELRRPAVLRLLAERSCGLLLAVEPGTLSHLGSIARACREAGVGLALWPLLEDGDGRFASDHSAERFGEHLGEVLRVAGRVEAAAREVVFDLEPPVAATRALLSPGAARPAGWLPRPVAPPSAAPAFGRMVREARGLGLAATAVVAPLLLGDRPGEAGPFQRLLATPLEGLGFDRVAVMAYSSLFEGYGRGLVRREDASALLAEAAARTAARWGRRGSLALGVVGGGALGTERPYRGVEELAEDVAVALACGLCDLSLHGLAGILGSERPEAWLDALVRTPAARELPAPTLRARALVRAGRGARRLATLALRPRRR